MKKLTIASILTFAFLLTGTAFVNAQSNMNMSSGSKMDSKMMLSDSDKEFAGMAAMGGEAEIKWAELAMQKSTNKDVKKYAAKMKKDHTKAGKNLDKVAMKHNMTLPKTLSEEQMQMLTQLQYASGADFDKMYIQMSGVDAHQKMEALFMGEITNGTDTPLKNFARITLPTVQMHLKMAQSMNNMSGSMTMKSGM